MKNYLFVMILAYFCVSVNAMAQHSPAQDSAAQDSAAQDSAMKAVSNEITSALSMPAQAISPKAAVDTASMVNELKNIYHNLEYNTSTFNDLKKKWFINDPLFVREAFNRFVVNNALRSGGHKVSRRTVEDKLRQIHEGEIIIDLRKRYYDDEIEYFAFIPESEADKENPSYLFDPVSDGFYLREVLGTPLYSKLQEQSYFFSNITKDEYDTKTGYYFDLNLNMLEPEIMFWTTTSNYRNKYLLSFFGKWGNDRIMLPGWGYAELFTGLKLTYHKMLSSDPEDYTYSIKAGTGIPTRVPFMNDLPAVPIVKSGHDIYVSISGKPLEFLFPSVKNLFFDIEAFTTIYDFKSSAYGNRTAREVYSIRNFLTAGITKKKILNLYDFGMLLAGAGYSVHSIDHFIIDPKFRELQTPDSLQQHAQSFATARIGIARTGGLVQNELIAEIAYNFRDDYGYWGVGTKLMLNDTFGFDLRYSRSIGLDTGKYPWRKDAYLVFSPIIRINY